MTANATAPTIIVDVANVMGARADGWWKDRAAAAERLCREVAGLARNGLAADELPDAVAALWTGGVPGESRFPAWVLVLEGRARDAAARLGLAHPGLALFAPAPELDDASELAEIMPRRDGLARIVLAPGSGDDAIVNEVADLRERGVVVTADRELRRRCEQAGALVAGPRWLLRQL